MATFTFTTDSIGRTIALTDTATVTMLADSSRADWTEIPDIAWGYSRDYFPGHPVHTLALELDEAAGGRRVDYIYATESWDAANHRRAGDFAELRAAGRVVCGQPHSGYSDMASHPVRWAG